MFVNDFLHVIRNRSRNPQLRNLERVVLANQFRTGCKLIRVAVNSSNVLFGGWKLNNGRRTIKRKRGEQRKGKTPNGEDWNSVSISISFEVEFSWLRSSSGRQPRARPSFLFENSASSWNICHSLSRCHRLMTSWLPLSFCSYLRLQRNISTDSGNFFFKSTQTLLSLLWIIMA